MGERHIPLVILMLLGLAAVAWGAGATSSGTDDVMIAAWKAHVLGNQRLVECTDGEDICWLVTPYLRGMVLMGEARGDRESLDAFCRSFERLQAIASEDMDGLFGWPTRKGSYGREGPRCIIMDDAYIGEPVAHFARVVRADAVLRAAYGERADKYLRFIEERIFPKWKDAWLDLGEKTTTLCWAEGGWRRAEVVFPEPAGVYRFFLAGRKLGTSLPLNQFLAVARTFLAYYDVTGKADYLDKARRMAVTAKYVYLAPAGDRLEPWCYWQPVWAGDFRSETEPARWVGPHPERASYHASEVATIAAMHQRGLVFTDADIHRLVRLHLDFMWNKSFDRPEFGYYYERRRMRYPAQLWDALAYFDPTIARLAAPQWTREVIERNAGRWAGITAVPEYLLRQRRNAE